MTSHSPLEPAAIECARPAWAKAALFIVFVGFTVWVSYRLGAFDLWAPVTLANGDVVSYPNAFASVDHPFHAVRAETLRRALADGEMLRWVGHHQGGYPVEFYPLGAAALDVLTWAVASGSIPMMAAHKLTVIAIFILPAVGYLLLAGLDRRSSGVAMLAAAAHVSVRGWWWSGGSMELIEWGLVTNVAAATALLLCLPLAARYVCRGDRRAGGLAGACAGFALVTNPRSGIAFAAALAGVVVAARLEPIGQSKSMTTIAQRLGSILALATLLAAPEIISLARYSDLYYFVHYSSYNDLRAYWDSSIQATGGPMFMLGLAGFVLAWLPSAGTATRAAAATLAVYVGATAMLVVGAGPASVIDQLEVTRLMPFQRLLWFYLAATAAEFVISKCARIVLPTVRWLAIDVGLVSCAVLVLVVYVVAPPSFIPFGDRGMSQVPSTASPGIVDLEEAVRAADAAAEAGTALLVLGTRGVPNAWHDQLWGPLWSDRPFFYDDWLWYWQREHIGDYDPDIEHAYRTDESALDQRYLTEHGIGAVVVTGDAKRRAAQEPYLARIRGGHWDVYRVEQPTEIVTFSGNHPETIDVDNQSVSATGSVSGGEIVVRRNWFPRWKASLNGKSVKIRHLDDGYMAVAAPESGEATIELSYGTDWIDWLGRCLSITGAVLLVGMLLPKRWTSRLERSLRVPSRSG